MDLLGHLREQIGFLEASAKAFDAGDVAEAKRLAIHLRVLLNDTKRQQSLLGQLDVKSSLLFHDVTGAMPLGAKGWIPLKMGFSATTGVAYLPKLTAPKRRISFAEWWDATVYKSAVPDCEFSRASIILNVAEKDGGAHVDPRLEANYATFSRVDFVTKFVNGQEVQARGPVAEMIRQMAHEILETLREQPVSQG